MFQSLLPDPVLRLKKVIGFGGHSTKWVRGPMLSVGWTSVRKGLTSPEVAVAFPFLLPSALSSVLPQ